MGNIKTCIINKPADEDKRYQEDVRLFRLFVVFSYKLIEAELVNRKTYVADNEQNQ
jgi:hypothetical protein